MDFPSADHYRSSGGRSFETLSFLRGPMTKKITSIFKRYEKKYLINDAQFRALSEKIGDLFTPDEFGKSVIMNIYFDTPTDMLIRRSIDKPVYKEKLRLRTYGVPNDDSNAFVEIKKKFKKKYLL